MRHEQINVFMSQSVCNNILNNVLNSMYNWALFFFRGSGDNNNNNNVDGRILSHSATKE